MTTKPARVTTDREEPYRYTTFEQLIADFEADVRRETTHG